MDDYNRFRTWEPLPEQIEQEQRIEQWRILREAVLHLLPRQKSIIRASAQHISATITKHATPGPLLVRTLYETLIGNLMEAITISMTAPGLDTEKYVPSRYISDYKYPLGYGQMMYDFWVSEEGQKQIKQQRE